MIVYSCEYFNDDDDNMEKWESRLMLLNNTKDIFEFKIQGRLSSINIVLVKSSTGMFIFIPLHNFGTCISSLRDKFLNFEKIQEELGPKDTASVVYGL